MGNIIKTLDEILPTLARNQYPPHLFILNIPYDALTMNPRELTENLAPLRKNRIKVYADGVQPSTVTLGDFPGLPIDGIKIDRSLCEEYNNTASLKLLFHMMDLLNLNIAIKNVDEFPHLAIINPLKSWSIQGKIWGEQVTVEEIADFLALNGTDRTTALPKDSMRSDPKA